MIQGDVTIRLTGLTRFRKAITSGTSAVAQRIVKLWAARYRAFTLERFISYSRGGGDWKPLSEATLKRRKHGGNVILTDIGQLRSAMLPGLTDPAGWETKPGPWRVEVGFGGPAGHEGGHATIADIASFHNAGGGHLPQRKIIVQPTAEVLAGMASDAERILAGEAKDDIEGGP